MKNNSIIRKTAVMAAKLIKKMAVFSANSASPGGVYQPVEPKEMKKYKK